MSDNVCEGRPIHTCHVFWAKMYPLPFVQFRLTQLITPVHHVTRLCIALVPPSSVTSVTDYPETEIPALSDF